jgi:glycosyltransferase involved in cell wall biosynthesis
MKVVHLVIGGDLRGGEMVALRLARAARARGDEAAFVSPTPGPFLEQAAAEGFGVHLVDVARAYRLRGALGLVRLLRRERADLLHTHGQIGANTLGRVAARLAGVPVISHLHIENYLPPNPARRLLVRTLDNATARLCARIVAVSEDTRRALVRQGYPDDRLEVVYNGIELDGAGGASLRRELGVGPEVPVIGELARLAAVKGQRELLEATARLDGDVRLVLIGDDLEGAGAFRRGLERDAERLGIGGRVLFAGYRPGAAALLDDLDVVVLPSWTEGLPIVLLEAMARGKPVVATPVGGTAELVADGETGLLVPPRDPEALAAAIGALLADPERRRRLGEAGYRRVAEKFTLERMTGRVLELYDEVLACRS